MPTFYRITRNDPPELPDFVSQFVLGHPLRDPTPEELRLAAGISVYDTVERARKKALGVPTIGDHIVLIDIPDDAKIKVERTGRSRGHYTLWGDPAEIMACWVPPTVPVR